MWKSVYCDTHLKMCICYVISKWELSYMWNDVWMIWTVWVTLMGIYIYALTCEMCIRCEQCVWYESIWWKVLTVILVGKYASSMNIKKW